MVLSITLSWYKIPNMIFSTLGKALKSTFWNKPKFIQHLYLSTSHSVHLSVVRVCVCIIMCVRVCMCVWRLCFCPSVYVTPIHLTNFCLFIFSSSYFSIYILFLLYLSICLSVCFCICLSVLPWTQPNPIQSSLTNSGVLYISNYAPLMMTLQVNVS